MGPDPQPARSRKRRLAIVAAALAASAIALGALLHVPFFRARVLDYTLGSVEERYGLRLEAARLDYNLAALRAGLAGVRLSAPQSPGEPFFEADYVSVTLPRRALFGDVAFEDIRVANARVRIVRRPDGTTNLPPSSERGAGEPPPLAIARLAISDLAVDIRDEQGDVALSVPAMTVLLTPDDGRLELVRPADVRVGDRRTRVTQLAGPAAFDGRALRLNGVQVRTDEAAIVAEGSLVLIASDPAFDLRLQGSGDVAGLARWGLAEGDLPDGRVAFDAAVSGPIGEPEATLNARSERVTWQGLIITDLTSRVAVTSDAADVQALALGFEGGRVEASGFIPFDGETSGRLNASWSGVDAASATLALAPGTEVVPAGALAGELRAEGPASDASLWSGELQIRLDGVANSRGRIAARGASRLQFGDGRWRLTGRHVVGGVAPVAIAVGGRVPAGPGGQPLQERIEQASLQGTLELAETSLPAVLEMLRITGLTEAPPDAVTSGTLDAEIRWSGVLSNPRMEGRAGARDVSGPQVEVAQLEATVTGRPLQPRLDFTVDAPTAAVAGQPLIDVRAVGRLADGTLVLDDLAARQPSGPGAIAGTATYDPRTGAYTASLDATDWQLTEATGVPLSGLVTVRASGSGTTAEPGGSGQIALRGGMWQDVAFGPLDASFVVDGRSAAIEARAPEFQADATARVQIDAPYQATVDARARGLELARVLRDLETPVQVDGTTTLRFHGEGPLESWRDGTASLEVASLDARTGELPVRLGQPALVRYAGRRLYVDGFEASAGETHMSASGELPVFDPSPDVPGMLVTVAGDVGEVARAAVAAGVTQLPVTGGDGPVALLARITGSVVAPEIAADVEVGPGTIMLQDLAPVSELRMRVHAEDDWIELREATAAYEGAAVSATGKAPVALFTGQPSDVSGEAAFRVRAANVTPAVLHAFVEAGTLEQLGGSMDATLDITSPSLELNAVGGELRFDRFEMRVADLPVTQRVPTRIVVSDGFARIEAWDWVGQGATLGVRGQVRLADRQSAILANGTVDLRMLTPFLRDAGLTTAGRLEPRLSITGPLDDPRVDGDLTVTGGEIRVADPRVLVSDLAVRTVLTRTSARVTAMTGLVNGGPLTGGGEIDYSADGRIDARLSTDIRGMALEFPEGLRSEVNAVLQLVLGVPPEDPPAGRLTGTVTVVRGAYREPIAVVTGLLANLRTSRLAAAGGAASPLLDALALDIRVLTDEDLIVDNNYGRLQLGADLRVIGTAAAPALSGRAELREGGQLFVGRNIYTINSGTIDFSNPVVIEPELNVVASTRAGGEDIEVAISGTPDAPTVELRSTSAPELGQAELASLLLTGRPFEELAPGDAAFVGTQVLGNFSAEVLGFAGRAVGLDTVRLGGVENAAVRRDPTAVATELDPTTRLTFGKSIGSELDVTFSQSLRDGDAQTWIVEYSPTRVLELRLVSDDEDLRSYGFRHEVTFGASAPRGIRPAAASRTEQPRVSGISIRGDLVFPERDVRGQLRLEEGDRFDFADWQADRDRLEAFYRQQGYLTARVAAAREETDGEVMLAYEVAPGPGTRIAVTGMDVDPTLRERLETAWAESVFDDFLIDEATAIVREALAVSGYLQPNVEARVADEDAARTLTIAVDPGTRFTQTIVRVDGADPLLTDEIGVWLETSGLVEGAAPDPGGVEDGVRTYLRSNGHLRAMVEAGAPLFEEGVAVVPLRVDAGPVFRIAGIAFDGAERLDEEALREAIALADGLPYDPAAQEAARTDLLALYRREGFPSPAITAEQMVHEDTPAVDVRFAIQEGPRQQIGEIAVSGIRAIDLDVVLRALDLEARAPLRSEELLQARTRVFETGLFRRVDVAAVAAEPSEDGAVVPMRVNVTVEEWPALRLRYGVQVAEERPEDNVEGRELRPGLSADLVRRTVFGRSVTLGGVFELQRREQVARLFVNTPTFFGTPIQSSLVADRSRETFEAVTLVTERTGVTWEQRARVAGSLSLSYAYRFERNHTFDTAPPPGVPAFDVIINIGRLTGSAAWDTRDDPADAARGLLASSSVEFAPEAAGSDIRFIRQLAQVYYFRPWRNLVLASAGRLGVVTPLGGQELLSLFRFFAGGSRTVRGVAEDSLGEVDFFGGPVGGRTLLVLNQEARVPIYRWVRGVAFVDAGNVFPRFEDLRLGDLVGSIGAGLRVATPFALLRLDYARPVWHSPEETSGRWYFGIGHAF